MIRIAYVVDRLTMNMITDDAMRTPRSLVIIRGEMVGSTARTSFVGLFRWRILPLLTEAINLALEGVWNYGKIFWFHADGLSSR